MVCWAIQLSGRFTIPQRGLSTKGLVARSDPAREGEARTRGTAQVLKPLTGGAEPPPHIGRQSRVLG